MRKAALVLVLLAAAACVPQTRDAQPAAPTCTVALALNGRELAVTVDSTFGAGTLLQVTLTGNGTLIAAHNPTVDGAGTLAVNVTLPERAYAIEWGIEIAHAGTRVCGGTTSTDGVVNALAEPLDDINPGVGTFTVGADLAPGAYVVLRSTGCTISVPAEDVPERTVAALGYTPNTYTNVGPGALISIPPEAADDPVTVGDGCVVWAPI